MIIWIENYITNNRECFRSRCAEFLFFCRWLLNNPASLSILTCVWKRTLWSCYWRQQALELSTLSWLMESKHTFWWLTWGEAQIANMTAFQGIVRWRCSSLHVLGHAARGTCTRNIRVAGPITSPAHSNARKRVPWSRGFLACFAPFQHWMWF